MQAGLSPGKRSQDFNLGLLCCEMMSVYCISGLVENATGLTMSEECSGKGCAECSLGEDKDLLVGQLDDGDNGTARVAVNLPKRDRVLFWAYLGSA